MEHGNILGNSPSQAGYVGATNISPEAKQVLITGWQSLSQPGYIAPPASVGPVSEADSEINRLTHAQERLVGLVETLEMRLSFIMRPESPQCVANGVIADSGPPGSVLGRALREYATKTEIASDRIQSIISRLAI